MRDACGSAISLTTGQTVKDELKDKILLICKNQKHYVQKLLNDLLEKSKENVLIFSDSSLIFLKDRAKSMRVGIGMISRGEVALIVAGVG